MKAARQAMLDTITTGLTAARATRADSWAESYRVMGEPYPGPFTFDYHPWTREMLCDDTEECVGQKAAQMGFTDSVAMTRAFYTLDKLKRDVLYVLPAKTPDATDFSAARFDPALERSPYLANLFTNVNNVGLKRAGANSLYVRGSRSRSALKSLPVGLIVNDEEDEFDQAAIILVRERITGQREGARQIWHISTPSIPGRGINLTFNQSTQAHYFFPCPHCTFEGKPRIIEFLFPDSLQIMGTDPITSEPLAEYICHHCKNVIVQEEKILALREGQWVHRVASHIHGYQISQMYSPVITASNFQRAVTRSETSPAEEQEFHNNKLGEDHIVEGAAITEAHIDACIEDYKMNDPKKMKGLITMGVDVGSKLHVEVDQWNIFSKNSIDLNDNARPNVVLATTVDTFDEIANLLYLYQPAMCVIDREPETRQAMSLARRYPGRVKLCKYTTHPQDLSIFDERVNANRTAWLDKALGRVITGMIALPKDIPEEWRTQISNLVRIPGKDPLGNPVYRYENRGPDHSAHARNYAEIALGCIDIGENRQMQERTN